MRYWSSASPRLHSVMDFATRSVLPVFPTMLSATMYAYGFTQHYTSQDASHGSTEAGLCSAGVNLD